MDVWFSTDVRAHILSGIVLTIRGAQRQGGDPQYIAGILAMAEHSALVISLDWSDILADAKTALGSDVSRLIDSALRLQG